MRVDLLFDGARLDQDAEPSPGIVDAGRDLGLETIIEAMGGGDEIAADVGRRIIEMPLTSADAIGYRQAAVADSLANPDAIRELYRIVLEMLERHRHVWGATASGPSSVLYWAMQSFKGFFDGLRRLRRVAVANRARFRSPAVARLLAEMEAELAEGRLHVMEEHIRRLGFSHGLRLSARLGQGNRGTAHVLRRPPLRRGWRALLRLPGARSFVYRLHPRDEAGERMLSDIADQGTALAAAALGRSADHLASYLIQLRTELAFHVACTNLHERWQEAGVDTCFPVVAPAGEVALSARELRDGALALLSREPVIANDVDADGRGLIVVTGANRGGKSTFLRSLGLAQLLLQAGMFVPAASFRADLRDGIHTHFRREEDAELQSGKLDEELERMSAIVDRARPGSLVLMNESFASTNEREASEIGRQVIQPMLDAGLKVVLVTHLFDLASQLARRRTDGLFLRADRLPDGTRTFRVVPGEPQPTSHGDDIYRHVFGSPTAA